MRLAIKEQFCKSIFFLENLIGVSNFSEIIITLNTGPY